MHVEAERAHINDENVDHATAERILCDASLVTMLHDQEGKILNVGRKTRIVPANIRRAVTARDKHCVVPGCAHRYVDIHHIQEWQHGGETSVQNCLSACRLHHSMFHEGRIKIEGTGDNLRFVDKNGRTLEATPPPRNEPLTQAKGSIVSHQRYEGVDYGLVVSQFLHRYGSGHYSA